MEHDETKQQLTRRRLGVARFARVTVRRRWLAAGSSRCESRQRKVIRNDEMARKRGIRLRHNVDLAGVQRTVRTRPRQNISHRLDGGPVADETIPRCTGNCHGATVNDGVYKTEDSCPSGNSARLKRANIMPDARVGGIRTIDRRTRNSDTEDRSGPRIVTRATITERTRSIISMYYLNIS